VNTVISCKNLGVNLNKKPILSDVNFDMLSGELVYLIGKTGTGKSSLLKVLSGDLKPSIGTADVAGFDVQKLKTRNSYQLKRKVGMVFQDHRLLMDRNIYDNLDFVLRATGWKKRRQREERIKEVLELLDLKIPLAAWPHELSGGEQQKLGIARSLLNNPSIIIADEPTGNLDPETSLSVLEMLLKLAKEKHTAILLATHDFKLIEAYPSRILVCKDNSIHPG